MTRTDENFIEQASNAEEFAAGKKPSDGTYVPPGRTPSTVIPRVADQVNQSFEQIEKG